MVESSFASVRLRTAAGKGYKKVVSATALIRKVLMVAESSFRRLDHPELIASGSLEEVRAALRVAAALGDLDPKRRQTSRRLADRVVAMIWRLIH